MDNRRVAVTGLGAISCLGNDVQSLWDGCLQGQSGIRQTTIFDASRLPCQIAGQAWVFDPSEWLSKKELRRLPRFAQMAVAATSQAINQARLNAENEDSFRLGVVAGCGSGGLSDLDTQVTTLHTRGYQYCDPLGLLKVLPDVAAWTISSKFGLRGPILTVAASCASGAIAIGQAAQLIRGGRADVLIAGGTEAWLTELGIGSFCLLTAVSTRNDHPTGASRPFDSDRDGFVPAEGAAFLVLEEMGRAQERGAPILAEVTGFGWTSDARHPVAGAEDGVAAAECISQALADAQVVSSDVDYVNLHGTSTPLNDVAEARALHLALGSHADNVSASATKSMIGHSLGAAAALEAVICVKTIQEQLVHPTINLANPDPTCQLNHILTKHAQNVRHVLSLSFAFGGQNACLVFSNIHPDR